MMKLKPIGQKSLLILESIGLFIIVICTIIACWFEVKSMIELDIVTLTDLLLLFIYLEVLSMVASYLNSGKLPVRMPLYIAIVALARYLILDMKNMDTWRMLGVAGAILLISFTVLVIRFGHTVFPYSKIPSDE